MPQAAQFHRTLLASLAGERIEGAALHRDALITWGDRLLWWEPPYAKPRVLCRDESVGFGQGGCVMDVDGDGRPDVIAAARRPRPALVWFRAPQWQRHIIEPGVDSADLMAASLFGRRGVVAVHRRGQVRFYEVPADPARPWPARDIYSFYTPSDQGGLTAADVDGDGRPDLVCGNYWIHSPGRFELPWSLYAINTWSEQRSSAMFRFAWVDGGLVACQREMAPARLAWFEKPADPRQPWVAHRLESSLHLDRPQALATVGRDFVVGESGGGGRLILFRNRGPRKFDAAVVDRGAPLVFATHAPGGLIGVGTSALYRWSGPR